MRTVRVLMAGALLAAGGCSSVMMKGTPLYTGEYSKPQGPPENRVNFWPAAYYHEPALSVLWPLMDFTDDHVALRPVFSVYKLDKANHEWNLVWPLVQFDADSQAYRIIPVFWGWDGEKPYLVAFPLVWWFPETKGIVPVFWWDSGFTVFPLAWYEKDSYCHLFPLWLHWNEGKGQHETHLLWPIVRLVNKEKEKGFRVWPLVGHYDEEGEKTAYALWPLCHYHRKGDDLTRVAFPLYFEHGEKGKSWWLVPPLAYRQKKGDDTLLLTPAWSAGRTGTKHWSALLPFYYASDDPSTGTSRLITPLAARLRSPERTQWVLVPLASSMAWGKDEKDLWFLGPLVHSRWGGDHAQSHALPLYYYDGAEKMFLSPIASWQRKPGEGFVNILTLLAHYSWGKDGQKTLRVPILLSSYSWNDEERDLCLPAELARLRWGGDDAQVWLFPLFGYDRQDKEFLSLPFSIQDKKDEGFVNVLLLAHYSRERDGRKTFYLPWPLGGTSWAADGAYRKTWLFPLFSWKRTEEDTPEAKNGKGEKVHLRDRYRGLDVFPWIFFTWSQESSTPVADAKAEPTHRTTRQHSFFPFWWYDYDRLERAPGTEPAATTHSDFRLLGWLYDHKLRWNVLDKDDPKKKPYSYVRSRILWRLMHYEQLDGDESLDLFPFITWDSRKDGYRKVSFMWRVFRNERTADGGRNLDILFLPLLRSKGKPPQKG